MSAVSTSIVGAGSLRVVYAVVVVSCAFSGRGVRGVWCVVVVVCCGVVIAVIRVCSPVGRLSVGWLVGSCLSVISYVVYAGDVSVIVACLSGGVWCVTRVTVRCACLLLIVTVSSGLSVVIVCRRARSDCCVGVFDAGIVETVGIGTISHCLKYLPAGQESTGVVRVVFVCGIS